MTGHVLDALNQPLLFFVLLVGTGGFLIVGELQMVARELRRTAGEGGATGRATWVGSPGRGRRYRLTLLAAAGLLLVSAFGTTSASFSSQLLFGGMNVDVAFPTITPAPTDTSAPTDTPTSKSTAAPTSKSTAAPPSVTPTPTMPILPTPVIACGTANGQWTCSWDNHAAMPGATPTWFENTGSGFHNMGQAFSPLDATTGGAFQAYLVVEQAGYRNAQSVTASKSTEAPTPTAAPTDTPTEAPTPTAAPTDTPTAAPTDTPVPAPTDTPVPAPTDTPAP